MKNWNWPRASSGGVKHFTLSAVKTTTASIRTAAVSVRSRRQAAIFLAVRRFSLRSSRKLALQEPKKVSPPKSRDGKP